VSHLTPFYGIYTYKNTTVAQAWPGRGCLFLYRAPVPSARCPAWNDWHQQQRVTSPSRHAVLARDRSTMWVLAYAGPGYET